MKIIGHRGSKGEAPENTMLGIKKAIDLGCDGVEIDIHLTKDHVPIVIHDPTLNRTTNGSGAILEHTSEEIKKFDAGQNEKIPFLTDVLKYFSELKINNSPKELFIEIKCPNVEKITCDLILKYNLLEEVTVKCFDHRISLILKNILPQLKTGIILAGRPVHPPELVKAAHADLYSVNVSTVDPETVQECRKHGYKTFVWNINNEKDFKKFKQINPDYISTDFPTKIMKFN